MRTLTAAIAASATAAALMLSGCSSDDSSKDNASETAAAAVTSAQSAIESAQEQAGSALQSAQERAGQALDAAKVTTFVAAFKATDLGTDLSDADIEAILSDTCDDLSGGMNDDEAKGALSERITTANNGNSPSNMQLEAIFAAAKVAC
jgi:PBP1b-binding outer membrane lipoprotein LpoB